MSLADDVDLEELVMTKDDLSGADIKAVCSGCRVEVPMSLCLLTSYSGSGTPGIARA